MINEQISLLARADAQPIRAGILQFDPPRLIGSQCSACGNVQFPARDFCSACRGEDGQAPTLLADQGTVYTYTVVHQSPSGGTPYVLAYVDLVDGVRVMARLEDMNGACRIGLPVRLSLRPVRVEDGVPIIGFTFVPADSTRKRA